MNDMDELDQHLTSIFDGKVVRKDLLHLIKKGTNVPTFVLEFLLARYCASDDQAEMDAGMEAVLATLQDNYVRPDEANAAQSKVATKGKHRFIDKVHVRYVEKEKRHWASLENFNSQRIAIGGVCQTCCPPISCGVSDFRDADFGFGVKPDGSGGLPVAGFS